MDRKIFRLHYCYLIAHKIKQRESKLMAFMFDMKNIQDVSYWICIDAINEWVDRSIWLTHGEAIKKYIRCNWNRLHTGQHLFDKDCMVMGELLDESNFFKAKELYQDLKKKCKGKGYKIETYDNMEIRIRSKTHEGYGYSLEEAETNMKPIYSYAEIRKLLPGAKFEKVFFNVFVITNKNRVSTKYGIGNSWHDAYINYNDFEYKLGTSAALEIDK